MNGLLWTSFADSTAISVLYSLLAALLFTLGIREAAIAFVVFCVIGGASTVGSIVTTKKQIEIGAEQLELIELKYKTDIEKRLNTIDN
jgi:hypothetical protein